MRVAFALGFRELGRSAFPGVFQRARKRTDNRLPPIDFVTTRAIFLCDNRPRTMTSHNQDPTTQRRPLLALSAWIVACFAASAIGAFFMPGEWYAQLAKPAWNPPNWIFGPVWTALYLMMAVAAWRVWRLGGFGRQRRPLTLFFVQLALNAAWSPIFFGLKNPAFAFAEILLLWLAISLTIAAFRRVDRLAAGLLAPYLAWVSFAALLNFTLWRLNG